MTYGWLQAHPVDALYRDNGIDPFDPSATLATMVADLASLPLVHQPGRVWSYGIATDVLAFLVQTLASVPFDQFLRSEVLEPLGMVDTGYHVAPEKAGRLATNYTRANNRLEVLDDSATSSYLSPPNLRSGGSGLLSTAPDYMRFCEFLLSKGSVEGRRILSRKTVEAMMANQLDGSIAEVGPSRFSGQSMEGLGFGFGLTVMLDPVRAQTIGTRGEVGWSGKANTSFWCDPAEGLAVVQMAQVTPAALTPIRRRLRSLIYQALVD